MRSPRLHELRYHCLHGNRDHCPLTKNKILYNIFLFYYFFIPLNNTDKIYLIPLFFLRSTRKAQLMPKKHIPVQPLAGRPEGRKSQASYLQSILLFTFPNMASQAPYLPSNLIVTFPHMASLATTYVPHAVM